MKAGLKPGPPDLAHWPVQEAGQGTQVRPGRNRGGLLEEVSDG